MTLPFCPESPKFLLLDRDDEIGANKGIYLKREWDIGLFYYTSLQSFLITISHSLALQLWGLLLNIYWLVHLVECSYVSTTIEGEISISSLSFLNYLCIKISATSALLLHIDTLWRKKRSHKWLYNFPRNTVVSGILFHIHR